MKNVTNKHHTVVISTVKLVQVEKCWMCAALCA